MPAARSFCTMMSTAEGLARLLAGVRADVKAPACGLVFVSGTLTRDVKAVAAQVRAAWKGVPVCVVPAAGVLTERSEIEGAPAVSGMLWSGGTAHPFALDDVTPQSLADTVTSNAGGRAATVLLFPRSDVSPDTLIGIGAAAPGVCLFGAGTVGGAAVAITAAGDILNGRAAGLVIRDFAPPLVESTPACRLVSPLRTIEEVNGGLVLRVDGTPALDALSACAPELRTAGTEGAQAVVYAALADEHGDSYVLRPVRGIDPARRGILIGAEARPGVRLAFAVRDAAAAKAGLDACARKISQQALGSAPRFAIYLTCAGRGQGLYGAPEIESRLLRQRFGDLPIAGMHSAFEIAPWGPGVSKLALYTGVLALFRAPS